LFFCTTFFSSKLYASEKSTLDFIILGGHDGSTYSLFIDDLEVFEATTNLNKVISTSSNFRMYINKNRVYRVTLYENGKKLSSKKIIQPASGIDLIFDEFIKLRPQSLVLD
jgi:hypothetical protein